MIATNMRGLGLVLLMMGTAGCGSHGKDPLTGTWKSSDGEATLNFAADGKFAATAPGGSTRGRYEYAGGEELRMEFNGISTTIAVSVADDQLTFCPEGHPCERLQKVE